MKNTNSSRKKVYFSLVATILFIFLFINLSSAVSLTLIESKAITDVRGTGGLTFDNTGLKLIAFDNWHGSKPNFVSEYTLSIAYNLSTIAYLGKTINITSNLPAWANNWSLSTAYISRDGQHAYVVYQNSSSDFNDLTIPHRASYAIFHFNITNFDISTISYSDFFLFNLTGINEVTPHVSSIFITDDGQYLTIGGRSYETVSEPLKRTYNTTSAPFMLTNLNITTSPPNFNFVRTGLTSYNDYSNLWSSPDNLMTAVLQRDIKQSIYYISIAHTLLQGAQLQQMSVPNVNYEGLTVYSTFTSVYLLTQTAGTLQKYYVSNIYFNTTEDDTINEAQSEGFLSLFINPILQVFPPYNTISNTQRIAIVLIVMFITTLILLYGGSQLSSEGLHALMLYVILTILLIEFIFFITIQYISIIMLVFLVLLATGVGYIALRSGGK